MRTAISRSLPFVGVGALALFLITLLTLSCSSGPHFDFQGTWDGHRQLDRPGADPAAVYTAGWVILKVKGDRFDLVDAGMPTSGTVSGSGNEIVLHTQSIINNLPMNREGGDPARNHPDIRVSGQKDGTVLFDDPNAIDRKSLKLTRSDKKSA